MEIWSTDVREATVIKAVSDVMNWEILKLEDNVAQWKLPTWQQKGEQQKIGVISVENYCGWIIMLSFDKLIDEYVADEINKRNGSIL